MKNCWVFVITLLIVINFRLLSQDQREDTIVAIVNNEIITYGEIVGKIKESLDGIEASPLSQRQKAMKKKQLMRIALQHLVDEKLTLQEAARYNIKISEKTVRKQVEKEMKQKGHGPIEGGEVDLTELIKSRLTLQQLFQKKTGYSKKNKRRAAIDTFVSPMEIRYYYKKNIQQFTKQSKIKTQIITLFYSKNGGRSQTLAKAEAIVKQLREGADFGELAKLYSNDPYAKEGGTWPRLEKGDATVWEFFGRGEALYKEVEDIAFSMNKGEISDPIPLESEPYCQIVKIRDIKRGRTIPFRKAQALIRQQLRYKKVVASLSRMKNRLRRRAFIWPSNLFKQDR